MRIAFNQGLQTASRSNTHAQDLPPVQRPNEKSKLKRTTI